MNQQYRDLPISSRSPAAIAAIEHFADELVSHGAHCAVIFDAVAADPECALAQAYAAALFLTAMTREGQVQAAPRIALAQALMANANERERHTIEAISAWANGDDREAIRTFRTIVEIWSYDLVAAKLCQVLELGAGDFAGMCRTSAMVAGVDNRSGHALGLHAFALEQAGDPETAYRFAQRAIELSPGRDPWAQHAAAHAMAAMGQPVEGRAFLHAHAPDWERCSSFMLTHNWWHAALFSIELGDESGALNLFDERVWGVRKGHCQDQVNAISLLARLHMHGVSTNRRWDDIADHVENRARDRVSAFLDLHYLYALAMAERGDAANGMVEALEASFQSGPLSGLARGIAAHARGDYLDAAVALGAARPYLEQVGGSNLQRDLFHRLFADSIRRMRVDYRRLPKAA